MPQKSSNAGRRTPRNPKHHQGHDAAHDGHLIALGAIVVDVLEDHRQERCQGEHQDEDEVREKRRDAVREHFRRGQRQIRNHPVESVARTSLTATKLAQES